jgi:hypothetical protein
MRLLDAAHQAFCQEPEVRSDQVIVLSEMTLHNLAQDDDINAGDFLDRADILCALGKHVMVSDYGAFYRLAEYLFQHTRMPIGVALGVPTLIRIFNEDYYHDLDGGILEAFGRLFRNDLRLYVCPALDERTGALITVHNLSIQPNLRHLYLHLLENAYIRELTTIDQADLRISSQAVLEKMRRGDPDWKRMVPDAVARIIKDRGLFNYPGTLAT